MLAVKRFECEGSSDRRRCSVVAQPYITGMTLDFIATRDIHPDEEVRARLVVYLALSLQSLSVSFTT